jgi:hypothetical protein
LLLLLQGLLLLILFLMGEHLPIPFVEDSV